MDPYRLVSLALAELGLTLARAGLTDDATAALDEADSRRGGAVGALGGVIGLGRLWCDAWAGRRTVAAGRALELAAAAVAVGNRVDAVAAAHTAAVLGASGQAAVVLDGLAATMEGPWVVLHAAEATARSRHDPASLLDTAERYAALDANGLGAVTAAAASELYRSAGRNGAALLAADRSRELRASTDGLPSEPDLGDLTHRESQVAVLAAEGLSSRDIAAALGVSVRTVDNHLGRAYRKLGVRARHELGELLGRSPAPPGRR